MDSKELETVIRVRYNFIRKRLDKIRPALMGKTLTDYLTFQPLKNINPNDADDPIPYRSDPDATLTQYELKLLAEQFQIAHQKHRIPLCSTGTREVAEPAWKYLEATEAYQNRLGPWVVYCKNHMVIGTCTSRFKIHSQYQPLVKRGAKGLIIDPKACQMLREEDQRRFAVIQQDWVMVIFGDYLYFVDPKRLNKVKYDTQPKLF